MTSLPFELAAFDLDGTLLDGPSSMSAANAEALRRLTRAGVVIAPATARFQPISVGPFSQAGLTVPAISAAGADVRAADGTVISQREMTAGAVRVLSALCDSAGWRATVSTRDRNYQRLVEPAPWAANPPPFLAPVTALADVELNGVLSFLVSVGPDDERRGEIEALGDDLNIHEAVRHDGQALLTVTARGVDKGSGLRDLCAALGIEPGRAIVFGDSAVDVPMFEVAGGAVAMAAAPPPVRAAAGRIAPAGPDAVARVLEDVFGPAMRI